LLAVLLIVNWIVASAMLGPTDRTRVSYTFFVHQIDAGNVASITATADSIEGTFKEPVHYPRQAESSHVTQFVTQRPAFADDQLLQLLESNNVVINANDPDRSPPFWEQLLLGFGPTLLLVALLVFGPGAMDVPVTVVLYVGLLATFVVVDGAIDLAEGLSLDKELGHRSGWWSLSANGMVAMAAGVAMFALEPGTALLRLLLVAVAVSHGAACLSAAWHVSSLLATTRRLDASTTG